MKMFENSRRRPPALQKVQSPFPCTTGRTGVVVSLLLWFYQTTQLLLYLLLETPTGSNMFENHIQVLLTEVPKTFLSIGY